MNRPANQKPAHQGDMKQRNKDGVGTPSRQTTRRDESVIIIDEISSEAPDKTKIKITQPLLDREAQKEAPAEAPTEVPTKVPTEVPTEQTKAGNRLPVGNTGEKAAVDT